MPNKTNLMCRICRSMKLCMGVPQLNSFCRYCPSARERPDDLSSFALYIVSVVETATDYRSYDCLRGFNKHIDRPSRTVGPKAIFRNASPLWNCQPQRQDRTLLYHRKLLRGRRPHSRCAKQLWLHESSLDQKNAQVMGEG